MKYYFLLLGLISVYTNFDYPQTAAELFAKGMEAYSGKDYVEALNHFDKFFLTQNENDELFATAKFYAGESLINLGEKYAAVERFEYLVHNFDWSAFRDLALYKLGNIYLDLRKYELSRERLMTLVQDYPNGNLTGQALYLIGETYVEEGQTLDAVKFFEEAIKNRKGNEFVDYSIYSLAFIYESLGDFNKAVNFHDQLLSFYKNSKFAPIAQFRIGYCYFNLKDYNSAIVELNNPIIKELDDEHYTEAIFILANAHYRLAEFNTAEEIFRKFILENPSSNLIRDANYSLAWSLFQQEKYNDAFEIFNSLSKEEDSIGISSAFWKAEALKYAGKESDALKLYEDFLIKYPNSELAQKSKYNVGEIYFSKNSVKESMKSLLETLSSEDRDVNSRSFVLLGEMNLQKNDFNTAKKNFKKAVDYSDSTSQIYIKGLIGLGISYFKLHQYNDAIKTFIDLNLKYSDIEPNEVNFYLAESYFAKGNFKEAVNYYNKVEKNYKELGNLSNYGKGYAYFNLKNYENAIFSFSDFIKQNPNDKKRVTDAKLRLADSYYGYKNYAAASKIYKEIFLSNQETAQDPYVQFQYAQALYKGGNSSEAISQFRQLQSSFPNSEYADKSLYLVGWIFFQKNSYADAINSYRVLLNTYPKSSLSPIVYYSIGDAFFNLNKFDSALVNYQRVIDLYPSSVHVYDAINGMLYCYLAQNKDADAISLIDNFVLKNPNLSFSDEIFFKKSEIYYNQGSYAKAKASYTEFTSKYPKSELTASAYYWIGKCAQNLNDLDEAVFNFDKVLNFYSESNLAAAAVIEIGNIYNQKKQYDEALAVYEKGINKLPNSSQIAEILFMKANTLTNKGDINAAYDVFAEIAQYHAETIFADKSKYEMGLIEYSAKRYENAIVLFRNISENRTDEIGAKAQYYVGLCLFEQGNTNEAISAFVRVKTVFSYFEEWLSRSTIMLGDCYKKLNDYEKAKQFYRDVLAKHRGDELGKIAQKKLREIE